MQNKCESKAEARWILEAYAAYAQLACVENLGY